MKIVTKINILGSALSLALLCSTSFANTGDDNSKVNQRDRSQDELTSDQQKSNKSDSEITRLIRRDLMKDSNLSTYAHNVKIITADGSVTLKGPVRSRSEANRILKCARSVAGASNVINEMAIVAVKSD